MIKSKDLTIKTLENEVDFFIQDHTRISDQHDRLIMRFQEEITKKMWWKFWKIIQHNSEEMLTRVKIIGKRSISFFRRSFSLVE